MRQGQCTVEDWQKGDADLRSRTKPLWKEGSKKKLKYLKANLNFF